MFLEAGQSELIDKQLAQRLSLAAGMRNILAQLYDEVNLDVVYAAVPELCKDSAELLKQLAHKFVSPSRLS